MTITLHPNVAKLVRKEVRWCNGVGRGKGKSGKRMVTAKEFVNELIWESLNTDLSKHYKTK